MGGVAVGIIDTIVKIGEIITQPITDKFFYWAMLTFILHHKDWKYANFNIAILMWVVHSTALMYPKIISFITSRNADFFKGNTNYIWKFQDITQYIFYYISEIIGDWYIFFIILKKVPFQKYCVAGILCLISNGIKLIICIHLFRSPDNCPKSSDQVQGPMTDQTEQFNCFEEAEVWRQYQKFECLNILFTVLYYGACFIILKSTKNEFDNQSKFNPSSFTVVKKFRRDSGYRMMFSSLCALVSSVFGIPFIIDTFKHNFDFRLEVTREAIMSLTYYMVYIDQILKSEQSGGQAFRSTSNDISSNGGNTGKTGFSSKGALDNAKVHDGNDFGATPWNNIEKNYGQTNYNNTNFNNYAFNLLHGIY